MAPMNARLLRPTGQFDPRRISGLEAWWDFSDLGTVTVSTGISSVADKSGKGRTATQSDGASQPLLVPNSRNGRSVADFDGVNDVLSTTAIADDMPAFTTFAVFNFRSYGGGLFGRIWTRNDLQRGIFVDNNGNPNRLVVGSGGGTYRAPENSLQISTWFHVSASSSGGGTPSVQSRINGENKTMTLSGTVSNASVANTAFFIGDRQTGTRQFDGLIGEVIIYGRVLTVAETDVLGKYMARKWGFL